MVGLSLQRWKTLQAKAERTLYTPAGLLSMGTVADNCTYPSYVILRAMGLPTELLSETQCRRRFPQFSTRGHDIFTYNREAGILHASTCLRTLKELVLDLEGESGECSRANKLWSEGEYRPVRLKLDSGDELAADRVVLATGGWVHRLLPHLRLPVRITRQYLLLARKSTRLNSSHV